MGISARWRAEQPRGEVFDREFPERHFHGSRGRQPSCWNTNEPLKDKRRLASDKLWSETEFRSESATTTLAPPAVRVEIAWAWEK